MWGTPISALLTSPTVTHEPRLSPAYEHSEAISSRIPHALSCTTTHENGTALRYAGATNGSRQNDVKMHAKAEALIFQ
jgi:hypothetical protein